MKCLVTAAGRLIPLSCPVWLLRSALTHLRGHLPVPENVLVGGIT